MALVQLNSSTLSSSISLPCEIREMEAAFGKKEKIKTFMWGSNDVAIAALGDRANGLHLLHAGHFLHACHIWERPYV